MSDVSSDNRRLQQRKPYYGRVDINAPSFPALEARARDISEGGMRLMMAREVKVGDRVLISKYGGTEVKLDEEKYMLVREDDILGVIA